MVTSDVYKPQEYVVTSDVYNPQEHVWLLATCTTLKNTCGYQRRVQPEHLFTIQLFKSLNLPLGRHACLQMLVLCPLFDRSLVVITPSGLYCTFLTGSFECV